MADEELIAEAEWVRSHRVDRGWSAAELARRIVEHAEQVGDAMSLTQQSVSNFERASTKGVPRWVRYARSVLEEAPSPGTVSAQQALARRLFDQASMAQLVQISAILNGTADIEDLAADQLDLVGIRQIDLAYGMGATFADGPVEVETLRFPRSWVRTITSSPPAELTWASGRGDSMAPTIHDGDIVLLDQSQRRVIEQDALWAYTVGDIGAIKRLRIKGDRVVILSDNPSVPPDEEPIELINIVARVIFIGKRT